MVSDSSPVRENSPMADSSCCPSLILRETGNSARQARKRPDRSATASPSAEPTRSVRLCPPSAVR